MEPSYSAPTSTILGRADFVLSRLVKVLQRMVGAARHSRATGSRGGSASTGSGGGRRTRYEIVPPSPRARHVVAATRSASARRCSARTPPTPTGRRRSAGACRPPATNQRSHCPLVVARMSRYAPANPASTSARTGRPTRQALRANAEGTTGPSQSQWSSLGFAPVTSRASEVCRPCAARGGGSPRPRRRTKARGGSLSPV